MNFYEIRCPSKRPHHKKIGEYLIVDDNCNMLLGFVGTDVIESHNIFHCKNCKRLIDVRLIDNEINMTILPSGTKIDTMDGSIIVDGY